MAACHLQDCDMRGSQRFCSSLRRENGEFGALLKGFCSSLLPISEPCRLAVATPQHPMRREKSRIKALLPNQT